MLGQVCNSMVQRKGIDQMEMSAKNYTGLLKSGTDYYYWVLLLFDFV